MGGGGGCTGANNNTNWHVPACFIFYRSENECNARSVMDSAHFSPTHVAADTGRETSHLRGEKGMAQEVCVQSKEASQGCCVWGT